MFLIKSQYFNSILTGSGKLNKATFWFQETGRLNDP